MFKLKLNNNIFKLKLKLRIFQTYVQVEQEEHQVMFKFYKSQHEVKNFSNICSS